MLNRQGAGKIDWTDFSWNPISGCKHNCPYCYLQRLVRRGVFDMTPRFHPNRLDDLEKLAKPSKIFVGSSGDMFGSWVPKEWVEKVLSVVKKHPEHIFQFLTKNPKRYIEFEFPKNCWLGTTIEKQSVVKERVEGLEKMIRKNLLFISFEPLLEEIRINLSYIGWIIIGANSNRGAQKPPKEWANILMEEARRVGTPIWIKDNYGYPERIKEFPKEVVWVKNSCDYSKEGVV